jgi:hypothetical protein
MFMLLFMSVLTFTTFVRLLSLSFCLHIELLLYKY